MGQETEYRAACQLEKVDDAKFERSTGIHDSSATKHCITLAKHQIDQKEYDEAEKTLQAILQWHRFELYAYLLRARMLEAMNRMSEAKAQRDKAQSLLAEQMRKERASMHTSAPLFVFVEDDPQETVRILDPSKGRLTSSDRIALAEAYFALGRNDEAIAEFEKGLADSKYDTAQAHFFLAERLRKARLVQKAQDHYRKAYEMDPENVTYRYEYEAIRQPDSFRKQ